VRRKEKTSPLPDVKNSLTAWQGAIEAVLHEVPGYNPWDQRGESWLDHSAALCAINWFADYLKHVEGDARGEPFILGRWQAAIVGNLFGWKRRDEKGREVRRYRKSLLYVPRGNGKTPLASGLALYGLFNDNEPGAQCYLAAGAREQAGFLFRNARGMVEQEPFLLDQVTIYGGDQHRSLVLKADLLSFLKVIPADAAGQHGGIPHITIVDELHVQESPDLVYVFETAMSKKVRSQPLLVMITTADYERSSICNDTYAHACQVRDNGGDKAKPGYDPSFFPVIYEAGQDADWTDEKVWAKANPNLGVSVSLESMREACLKAQEQPAFENEFRRLHLNQRTKQDVRLISLATWDASGREFDIASLTGKVCYGGLDLSSTRDLSSFDLLFPLEDDYLAVLSWSWCPEQRIVYRARQKFPYDVWSKQGWLTGTSGDWIDYEAIQTKIDELYKLYSIREIGYDPHGAADFMQTLMRKYGDKFVTPITQTFGNLAAPTKELSRRVHQGKVIHFKNPVLRWAIGNAAIHYDGKIPAGGSISEYLEKVPIMLSKRKSEEKIDPAAALVNALARMLVDPNPDRGQGIYFKAM